MRACMCACIHGWVGACMCVYVGGCMHAWVCVCVGRCMHACMHGWVGTCVCAWAGRGESRTEQQKRGQEPGSGSQNPGTVLGELKCLASMWQEISDSELGTGRWLPCGMANHTLLTRKYVFQVGRLRHRAVIGWLTAGEPCQWYLWRLTPRAQPLCLLWDLSTGAK